jgi:DNA-binding transcriptional LysR family regulator
MLDVRRLRLLSELARRGTIAEVAKSVGYSASAVSQSLSRLEHEAGMPLLDLLVSESYDDVSPAPAGGLERHLLLTEELLLVLPSDHVAREPVDLRELAGAPWVAGVAETQFVGALELACRAAGFAPRIVHRADDATLHHALVAAGLGIGLLPALACTPFAGVRYARAEPAPPRRHVAALLRRGAAQRPALAATLAALRDPAYRGVTEP